MKQSDRFERMVEKTLVRLNKDKRTKGFRCSGCLEYTVVITLLRKEHAWMRRMVKKVDAWACQELADNDDVIAEIMKQLDQRRK